MGDEPKKPTSEALKKFQQDLESDKELDKKKKNLQETKLLVDSYRYTNELEKITQNEADMKRTGKVNVGVMSDEDILEVQNKNRVYLEGAKNGMLFLNQNFKKFVPAWAGNLILVGGRTGGGKSSAAANLIYSTIKQINPVTGKNRRVLCISAEESILMVYNRLTCLIKGWDFNNIEDFTDEQKQALIDFSGKWPKMGVSVIGKDDHGKTDSLEGIKSIFKNLVSSGVEYDMILVDYIQKITMSKKNPNWQQFTVIKEVMNIFDYYKDIYPAVIVIMSQLSSQKAGDPENELDFQDRLRGSKDIITPCTVALEMVPDYKRLSTKWFIRKNRYKGNTVGDFVETAYDRGMFRPMTDEWKKGVAEMIDSTTHNNTIGKYLDEPKNEVKTENKE